MDMLQERIALLGRSLALLAAWAIVAGALSIALDLGNIADGEAVAIVRAALGVLGIAAGLMVWTLRRAGIDGWQALMAWSVLQIPYIAWSADGNAFRQVLDMLLGFTSSTTAMALPWLVTFTRATLGRIDSGPTGAGGGAFRAVAEADQHLGVPGVLRYGFRSRRRSGHSIGRFYLGQSFGDQ